MALVSSVACAVRAARSRGPVHRLAEMDDHILGDLGLRRTDLYALGELHRFRIHAACCQLRDLAFRVFKGHQPPSCC